MPSKFVPFALAILFIIRNKNSVVNKINMQLIAHNIKNGCLQGSISVQVNAGPLAYATTFLGENNYESYPVNQVARLKEVYR